VVQEALLTREMNFKVQTTAVLPSMFMGGCIGISWAFSGFGVWALVGSTVGSRLLNTLLLWRSASWRPKWQFSLQSLRSLSGYGSRMAASGLLETVFGNLYVLIIGKLYSVAELAFYSRANTLVQMPVGNLQGIIGRVIFPVFSAIQDDADRLRQAMQRGLRLISFFIFPALAGLAVVANDLIVVLIGEKWIDAAPLVQLMCVAGSLYCFHALNLTVLTAKGFSKLFLRLEVIKKVILLLMLGLTASHGVSALVLGQAATSILALWVNAYYTDKFIGYGLWRQIVDMLPYVCGSFVAGGIMWVLRYFVYSEWNAVSGLVSAVVGFTLIYTCWSYTFKLKGLGECLRLLPVKVRNVLPSV
jgi:teichuronic acid exporter